MPTYRDEYGNLIDENGQDAWVGNIPSASEALSKIIGAPKAAADYLITRPASWFGFEPKEGETAGSMLSEALLPRGNQERIAYDYLNPISQMAMTDPTGYAASVLRPAARMATDIGTDPTTALVPGGGVLGKMAGGYFTAQGAKGTGEALGDLQARLQDQGEGLTPENVERGTDALLNAGMTGLGAKALTHKTATQPGKVGVKPTETPASIQSIDLGDGFTGKMNPKTGTLAIQGPSGEKLTAKVFDGHIEMISIGKGDAPNPKAVIEKFKSYAGGQEKPIYSTSTNLSTSGGQFRDNAIKKGHLVPGTTPGGTQGYLWKDTLPGGTSMATPPPAVQSLPHTTIGFPELEAMRRDATLGTPSAAGFLPEKGSVPTDLPPFPQGMRGGGQPGGLAMEAPKSEGGSPQAVSLPSNVPPSTKVPPGDPGARSLYLAGGDGPMTLTERVIDDYLQRANIKLERGETTKHQALLRVVGEKGIDQVAEGIGWSRQQLIDALTVPSELGRQLNSVKMLSVERAKLLEEAAKDPQALEVLRSLDATIEKSGMDKVWDVTNKTYNALQSTSSALKEFAQASVAGTIGVSVTNFINGLGNLSLSALNDTLIKAGADLLGKEKISQKYDGSYSKGLWQATGGTIGRLIRATSGKDVLPNQRKAVSDLRGLVEDVTPEQAEMLYHAHFGETFSGKNMVSKVTHPMLVGNMLQDTMLRNAYLSNSLEAFYKQNKSLIDPLVGEGKTMYEAMQARAQVDPKFRSSLKHALDMGSMEALRASGGLRAPRGTITRGFIDLIRKIPFSWAVPGGLFLEYPLSNALPMVLEYIPMGALLSTRARRSLQLGGEVRTMEALRDQSKVLETKKGELSGPESKALLLLKEKQRRQEMKVKDWEREGVYEPERVWARQAVTLPLVVSLFAAWRVMKGDTGEEYNQIKDPKTGKVLDISSHLGAYATAALIGDMIGHKALGTDKYQGAPGKVRLAEVAEVTGTSRTGAPSPLAMMGEGEISEDYLMKMVNRAGSDLGRVMTTGAWMGESARALMAGSTPQPVRRTDLSPMAGAMSNVPPLAAKLPPAIDKTSGDVRMKNLPRWAVGMKEKDSTPIQEFLNANKGWTSPRDVLTKATSDPEYDALVMKFQKEEFQNTVIPWIQQDAKSLPKEERNVVFQKMMQDVRQKSIDQAIQEYVMEGKDLPPEVVKSMETNRRRQEILMENPPPPMPPTPGRLDPNLILELQGGR